MRILITGIDGFIGRNLAVRLGERGHRDVVGLGRGGSDSAMSEALGSADIVFHLAGINRPTEVGEFKTGNADFTRDLCRKLADSGRKTAIVYTSSTQAELDNPYGASKRLAEAALQEHSLTTGAPVHIFRLTNVFGKWSRPNYNSAVATFCHNIARGLAISINDPQAPLRLVYIDDVVDAFIRILDDPGKGGRHEVEPVYDTTVGVVAALIRGFADGRTSLMTERVGGGLPRALHATYLSFLPPQAFAYGVPRHTDPRGEFVEMLKTADSGQFSYFTAHPGITRGEHYHHSKTEKFLVIRGTAQFGFRHIVTGETHVLLTRGGEGRIVETAPGWAHNVTNVGTDELIVLLWANEIFDRDNPDTFAKKVDL